MRRFALIITSVVAIGAGASDESQDLEFGHFGMGLNVLQLTMFSLASAGLDGTMLSRYPWTSPLSARSWPTRTWPHPCLR